MASEKDGPKDKEKKERKLEIRDLKPKKEIKGGATKPGAGEKQASGGRREMDFMGWE
ncbi:MAG: hypothetical protein ACREIF_16330 [Chthoniobacterales bacterium]